MNFPDWSKSWREAAVWALAAAFVFEGGCNVLAGRTIWHRLSALEHHVQDLQHEREKEEIQMNLKLDQLREKAQNTAEKVEQVDEKVEKKKDGGHK